MGRRILLSSMLLHSHFLKTRAKFTAWEISLQISHLCFMPQLPTPCPLQTQHIQTQTCAGIHPHKKNMTLSQCFISQWAALASIQWVKSETKTPFTTLSSVVSYKSWQYHLQTSFKQVFFSSFLLPMQPYRCPIMSCLDHSSSFLTFLITSTQASLQPLSTQLPELSFHL